MFCPKCNKEIEDDAKVCEFCGAEIENGAQTPNTPEAEAENTAKSALEAEIAKGIQVSETENAVGSIAVDANAESDEFAGEDVYEEIDLEGGMSDYSVEYGNQRRIKKSAFVGFGVAAVCVIAAIIIAVMSLSGGSPKTPVSSMIKGISSGTPSAFFNGYPKQYQTVIEHNRMIEFQLEDEIEEQAEEFKQTFGNKAKLVYKITNKQKLSADELDEYQTGLSQTFESMEEMYGEDFGKTSVTDGYVLSLDFSVQNTDMDAHESMDVTVLKVNGKWSVSLDDIGNLASVFYNYSPEGDGADNAAVPEANAEIPVESDGAAVVSE